ncbi:MAG: crossover junction endodeoxyribonuclease RuvC [Christensenellales bacterium]|jgi:crossover junction endodeoxyribonuclease RuvC
MIVEWVGSDAVLDGKVFTVYNESGECAMVIMGIDPGLATVGFGVIESDGIRYRLLDCGTVKTTPDMSFPQRLATIFHDTQQLIAQHRPDAVALEELFFYRNIKTAMHVAQARGASLVAVANALPEEQIFEYTPMEIKLAVCGYGHAEKRQIQETVRILMGMKDIIQPDDAADAVAIAICHANTRPARAQYQIR